MSKPVSKIFINSNHSLRSFSFRTRSIMATYSAVAVTFVLSLVTIGFMVLFQPRNLFTTKQFDVKDVGAIKQAITSVTLEKNWNTTCASGTGKFELSTGNSQIGPVTFRGPCKGGKMEVNVIGTVMAIPKNAWPKNFDTWIMFENVPNLHITGSTGKFDGQGSSWWNTCQKTLHNTCENNPTALAFHNCHGLVLDRVTSTNSQRNHISINACNGATVSHINIEAPGDSPNTDGIDISATNGVNIIGGHIGTGDDCIAINGGSFNINITDLNCGPGHGISVGSLGRNNAREFVGNIKVVGATFTDTQNGVRIKTVPGGSGNASQITFSNIGMTNVQHPIILTHFYCPHTICDKNKKPSSVVQIKDVSFNNIHGTSARDDAINIYCALNPNGCVGITLENINIQPANRSGNVGATCKNTIVVIKGKEPVIPRVSCIQTPPSLSERPWDYNYDKSQQALIATS